MIALNSKICDRLIQINFFHNSDRPKLEITLKSAIALRQLNHKLGNLSEETTNRIKSLESSQLDSLTDDLLDFQSVDDLLNWLKNS